jgi:ABC-2 type transport system ATP-binding protein
MPPEVLVHDLTKSYDGLPAIRGVSFEVRKGEIFGLLGPNGAGKTTTLECILGLRHPDAGSITIAGIDALENRHLVQEMIGAVLQTTGLQERITPREALDLFGSFYHNAIKSDQLLSRFSLTDKADSSVDSLSGGQRQRLALALAFVNDPPLLFLDEPTAGLDPQARRQLHDFVRQGQTEGRTAVLSTHYIEEAHQLCDRIAIIDRGRVVACGTPRELIDTAKTAVKVFVQTAKPLESEVMQSVPAVTGCQPENGGWQLRTSDVTATLSGLMRLIQADANELRDLRIQRPSLEDVFIELTGTQLRDD